MEEHLKCTGIIKKKGGGVDRQQHISYNHISLKYANLGPRDRAQWELCLAHVGLRAVFSTLKKKTKKTLFLLLFLRLFICTAEENRDHQIVNNHHLCW